jgi:hypothetical protein
MFGRTGIIEKSKINENKFGSVKNYMYLCTINFKNN